MELKEIYQKDLCVGSGLSYPRISFEVFPPKDGDSSKLFEELRVLKKYNPALVSLTYGANGGNRQFSYELLQMILDLELNVMPHFTCVGATKEIIELYIMQIENLGIENILALRGDLSDDVSINDFKYASDLVDFIHQKSTLSIGVAGYPECHIECENLDKDIDNLKRKIDLGASAIFTQLFFDNDKFYCSELIYDIYKNQLGIELCKPKKVSDYLILGLSNLPQLEKDMEKREITKEQYVVAPVDIFESDYLEDVKQ